jgi:hypothetical protein
MCSQKSEYNEEPTVELHVTNLPLYMWEMFHFPIHPTNHFGLNSLCVNGFSSFAMYTIHLQHTYCDIAFMSTLLHLSIFLYHLTYCLYKYKWIMRMTQSLGIEAYQFIHLSSFSSIYQYSFCKFSAKSCDIHLIIDKCITLIHHASIHIILNSFSISSSLVFLIS